MLEFVIFRLIFDKAYGESHGANTRTMCVAAKVAVQRGPKPLDIVIYLHVDSN